MSGVSKRDQEGVNNLLGVDRLAKGAKAVDGAIGNMRAVAKQLESKLGLDIPTFAKGGVKMKKGRPPKKLRRRK